MTTDPATGPASAGVGPAPARLTVASGNPAITAWIARHLGVWTDTGTVHGGAGSRPGPVVRADVDPAAYGRIANSVLHRGSTTGVYARSRTHILRDHDGTVLAVASDPAVAYRVTGHGVGVTGIDVHGVRVAAARVAREIVRARLEAAGFVLLYGAAVARGGRALLIAVPGQAVATITALLLARQSGLAVLSTGKVFARAERDGTVSLLPWAGPAAIGLPALDALGLYATVQERVLGGEELHHRQDQRVDNAFHLNRRAAMDEFRGGPELPALLHPYQLRDWFGIGLAPQARAGAVVVPRFDYSAPAPSLRSGGRPVDVTDLAAPGNDLLGLRAAFTTTAPRAEDRPAALALLNALPRFDAVLTTDVAATADMLSALTADLESR
ncbi:hypothetical protein SAMN05216251_12752 [Actinacidiphila alni]|uniref:Uncharacterized protein n=1 Tax=Actinacidiphila alni TaxID=380248 RepID=A0A1I2L8A0_9ACTN|nr:hypothetical protein [Actinacidiphila alni]SFF75173.1 hypothetical protein SAMN05216251_12752 [Actinacidiphila alni]